MPSDCFGKEEKIKPKFSLKSILKGRRNFQNYSFFFDRFVPLLERKSLFENRMKNAIIDEELICISSEAFGLLVLENHWDRWLDIYMKSRGRISIRGGFKMKNVCSSIQPRYTRGGLRNGKNREIGIGKGWSMEGIYHFNKLFYFVKRDQCKHPNFVTEWLQEKRKTGKLKTTGQTVCVSPEV